MASQLKQTDDASMFLRRIDADTIEVRLPSPPGMMIDYVEEVHSGERWLTVDYKQLAALGDGMHAIPNSRRIKTATGNEYCATGEGGGKDPTCSPGGAGSSYESLGEDMPGNLKEDLDYITESDDPADERVQAVLDHYKCKPVRFMGDTLPGVYSNGSDVVEWDGGDASVSDVGDFVYNYDMSDIEAKYETQFNDDFWSGPGTVYHATQDDNRESIEENGLNMADDSRGMSNRSEGAAVYTTAEWEEAISGSYGDTIFEIDTQAMAADGVKPYARQEPDISRGDIMGSLAHALGDERFNYDYESGMSPNTIVLSGHIPPKYLKNVSANR